MTCANLNQWRFLSYSLLLVSNGQFVCDFLRDGYRVFFDHLEEQRVPLLIFSAGVGDVLEEVIQQNHVFHPNVHVISNYMDFDQTVSVISCMKCPV